MGIAEEDIIRSMIGRLGQSQGERSAPELDVRFAEVDDRTTAELFQLAGRLARRVNYFRDDIDRPDGDWTPFFPDDEKKIREILARNDGTTASHHALFIAFLELYKLPQEVMNRLTGRHLDFYYRDVLRLEKRPPQPDRGHLLIELKKGMSPLAVTPEHLFTAGKDPAGKEILYAPTGTTVINHAQVTSLLATYVDDVVRAGEPPAAASGCGRHPFGNADMEEGAIGFAISSPLLTMRGGERTVTLTFSFDRQPEGNLDAAFDVFVTGEKGWISCTVHPQKETDKIVFVVPPPAGAVIPYATDLHLYRFAVVGRPVALFLLKQDKVGRYTAFRSALLSKVNLSVAVTGVLPDAIETDAGSADPKKPFLPFGPHPTHGARFTVACAEALGKELASLDLPVRWKGLPNLADTYGTYAGAVGTGTFTASVSFADSGDWTVSGTPKILFDTVDGKDIARTFSFERDDKERKTSHDAIKPIKHFHEKAGTKKKVRPEAPKRPGGITFTLNGDFFHALYRQKYIETVTNFAKAKETTPAATLTLPKEPYTPAIESLTVGYTTLPEQAFPPVGDEPATVFHHVAPFGTRVFARDDRVTALLPDYPTGGELAIGIAPLSPGDSVSLLFQVVEGSADPEAPFSKIVWSVLCGDEWREIDDTGISRDTTDNLRRSGIITFAIPQAASLDHTLMPPGVIWLRGRREAGAAQADLLVDVAANGVEVVWQPTSDAAAHLATALPAGKLTKTKTPLPAVKSIRQPYPSFGGRGEESESGFHTRVAERLRHRNRCISTWDFERVVLEEFPKIHRVKCIPHAQRGSFLSPGHMLLIVIPDLRNRSGLNLLQPRVDKSTRDAIQAAVAARAAMGATIHVENPLYRSISLDFAVRFNRPDFNYWRDVLHEALVRFLSPWAFDSESEVVFGGTITKSVVIDFVEELDYVDFITDVVMTCGGGDVNEATPQTPDEILVSAERHTIREVKP